VLGRRLDLARSAVHEDPEVIIWFHVVAGSESGSAPAEPVVDEAL
jgi:hypothetical protein